jgi:hypothetical protein
MGYLDDIEQKNSLSLAELARRQEEEDELEVQRLVGKTQEGRIERRLNDEDEAADQAGPSCSSTLREEVAAFSSTAKSQLLSRPTPTLINSAFLKPQASKRGSDIQAKLLGGMIVKKKK